MERNHDTPQDKTVTDIGAYKLGYNKVLNSQNSSTLKSKPHIEDL